MIGEAELAKLRADSARLAGSEESKSQEDPDAVAEADEPESEANPAASLCWQDYCPCESPETSLDITICRNARGGIEMSDDQWSIGAMARDSKREGDRLNAEMDTILKEGR